MSPAVPMAHMLRLQPNLPNMDSTADSEDLDIYSDSSGSSSGSSYTPEGTLPTYQTPSLLTAHIRTSLHELDRILQSMCPIHRSSTRSRNMSRLGLGPGLRRVLSPEDMRAYLDCAQIIRNFPLLVRDSEDEIKVVFALILEQDSQENLNNSMTSRTRAFLQGRAERNRSLGQLFDPTDSGHSTETPTLYNRARLRATSPHSHIPDIPDYIITLEHILHVHSALWRYRRRTSMRAEHQDLGSPHQYFLRIKNHFVNGAREVTVVMRLDTERLFHFEIYDRPSNPPGEQAESENMPPQTPEDILATLAAARSPREDQRGILWNHRVTLRRILGEPEPVESHPEPEENDYGVPVPQVGVDPPEHIEPRVTINMGYFTIGARSVR